VGRSLRTPLIEGGADASFCDSPNQEASVASTSCNTIRLTPFRSITLTVRHDRLDEATWATGGRYGERLAPGVAADAG